MLRTWRPLVPALLLALFALTPARGEERSGPEPSTRDQLADIQRSIDDLRKELVPRIGAMENRQNYLSDRITQLERQLADLQRKVDSNERVAKSFTPTTTPTGNLRLENRSALRATVILNSRAYELMPGQSAMVYGQPSGTFTYEVLVDAYGVIQPSTVRFLRPGQTYEIFVNP